MAFAMWKTWVVVAESSRAKIYGMKNLRTPLVELDDLIHPEGRLHARDLTSSRPGRAYDISGRGRHAMEVDVDCTAGDQVYYEDCQVCCAPVKFTVKVDDFGNLVDLWARRDDE